MFSLRSSSAHRSAIVKRFKEIIGEAYFHPNGTLMQLLKTQIKASQLKESDATFLRELGDGTEARWTVPGAEIKEMKKVLRKLWDKCLAADVKSGDRRKSVSTQMGRKLQQYATPTDFNWSQDDGVSKSLHAVGASHRFPPSGDARADWAGSDPRFSRVALQAALAAFCRPQVQAGNRIPPGCHQCQEQASRCHSHGAPRREPGNQLAF